MAHSPEEEQRLRRRRRLTRGLIVGAAAIGLPAAFNALVSRRAERVRPPKWALPEEISWEGASITYRTLGAGPPLVALHSLGPGHSSLEWRAAGRLLARHAEVVAPDLPGWGESTSPPGETTPETYSRWLIDFLERLLGEPAVLLAAGQTAPFAVAATVERPALVRALCLVSPNGVVLPGETPDFRDTLVHRLLGLPVLGTSALNLVTSRSNLERYLLRDVYHDPSRVTEELVDEHYRLAHHRRHQRTLVSYLSGRLDLDVTPLLPRLEVPVWIGWGREAQNPAVAAADLWLRELSGAELEVFAGSAALPHVEVPRLFVAALSGFLARLAA